MTQEVLNKIHISQLQQYIKTLDIKLQDFDYVPENYGQFNVTPSGCWLWKLPNVSLRFRTNNNGNIVYLFLHHWDELDRGLEHWQYMIQAIYPEYEYGNLGQLFQLLEKFYNDVISYEVKDE